MLEGVGPDAGIVVNNNGGKQSSSPMAMHLVDPKFLQRWCNDCRVDTSNVWHAIGSIACFMEDQDSRYLDCAINLLEGNKLQQLIRIAKVLKYGADRYEPNNWRLIPQEDHINHALIHIIAHLMGDTQDDHIDHALCRLMMALATSPSEGFRYTSYVK